MGVLYIFIQNEVNILICHCCIRRTTIECLIYYLFKYETKRVSSLSVLCHNSEAVTLHITLQAECV